MLQLKFTLILMRQMEMVGTWRLDYYHCECWMSRKSMFITQHCYPTPKCFSCLLRACCHVFCAFLNGHRDGVTFSKHRNNYKHKINSARKRVCFVFPIENEWPRGPWWLNGRPNSPGWDWCDWGGAHVQCLYCSVAMVHLVRMVLLVNQLAQAVHHSDRERGAIPPVAIDPHHHCWGFASTLIYQGLHM